MSSHINDFNNHIQSYFVSSTYGNETQLINSLNYLALVTDQRAFDLSVYGNNIFFVNLHRLMSTGAKKMSLMWVAVAVLETASKSEEIRQALIRKFHYLPTLANLLKEIHTTEQQQRMLALIEKLTHGAQLESYEPYVESLIVKLLAVMEQGSGQKDKTELVTLALSILVNLCYGNLAMTYVLTKNITVSSFCKQIKHLGLVTCKMYIILERNDYMKELDLHYLLKMSFQEVKNILATKNSFILRHVVDYLHYIRQLRKENCLKEDQRNAVSLQENFFRDNLKDFLEDIERYTLTLHSEKGNARKRRKVSDEKSLDAAVASERDDCMNVLFEILACIVDLEPIGEDFRKRIADIALKWIRTKQSCSCAVDLLRVILEKCGGEDKDGEVVQKLIDACQAVLDDLVTIVHNNSDQILMISISKLLTTLVNLQGASNSTLDKAAEQFFQHSFGNILSSFKSSQNFDFSLPDSEIEAFLWALHAFHELANVSPTLWFAKMGNLLRQKPIHFLIARGLTSNNSEMTEATLAISSFVEFPRKDVSQMIIMLNAGTRKVLGDSQQSNLDRSGRSVPLVVPPPASLSRDLLERMDRTVTQIQDAVSSESFNDATQVQLIEFYDAKIRMEAHLMQDLQGTVEGMSKQISTLMHQNQLLTAEVDRVQRRNLPLALKVSTLQAENQSQEKELNQVKSATASYDKKINQLKHDLSDYIKRYNEKNQQWVTLTKQIEQQRSRESNYEKENKRLQHELSNMAKTSEESRRLLRAADEDRQKLSEQKETDRKLYEGKIRERDRELSKRNELINQLEQQLTKRDSKLGAQEGELKDLMAQIVAKNERIEEIEDKLKESENIQTAIYSLMNKKGKANS